MAEKSPLKDFQNFPVPRLDDRSFVDLMEEMRALIPVYCPAWTNHNASDPGIALLELFAFLTDVLLYRTNRIPVRNLFSLLNLLGVQPRPPAPARTIIAVSPNAESSGRILKRQTQIGAYRADTSTSLIWETEDDLMLVNCELARVISCSGSQSSDVTHLLRNTQLEPFPAFSGATAFERYLYFLDGRFLTLKEEGLRLHLRFSGPSAVRDLYARWHWQYFNGDSWISTRLAVAHGHGEVVLETMEDLEETLVEGQKGPWIRAFPRMSDLDPESIQISEIEVEVESVEDGVMPSALFLNSGEDPVMASLDCTRVFYPLGEFPRLESTFYIFARDLFRAAGTRVELQFNAPPESTYPRPDPSPELVLRIEYPISSSRWATIRTISPNPLVQSGDNRFNLEDHTRALRREGVISFTIPPDIVSIDLQGIEGPWIRMRLVSGEYRSRESALKEEEYNPAPERPVGPAFESLLIRSRAPTAPLLTCLVYNGHAFAPLWNHDRPRGVSSQPFPPLEHYTTALYLGFSQPFPKGTVPLFFTTAHPDERLDGEFEPRISQQKVQWEVGTSAGFVPLPSLTDDTLHFKREGFIRFYSSGDFSTIALFGYNLCWIRARLVGGFYEIPPFIRDIRTNCVSALNVETWVENSLHRSDGQAFLEIKLQHHPILGNLKVWVKEPDAARAKKIIKSCDKDAILEDDEGYWFCWEHVEHLLDAGPDSHCFRLDAPNGVIHFGDGRNGRIPPANPRAVRIESYQIGGGSRGNVGPHTLTVLRQSHASVSRVTNPYPAEGGAEAEDLVAATQRATRRFFRSDRALRLEDYEAFAREASRRVARVYCLEPRSLARPAHRDAKQTKQDFSTIRILILPQPVDELPSLKTRPIPGEELIQRVEHYLEARRAINVQLRVTGPVYVPFRIHVSVYLRGHKAQGVEEDLEERLWRYLHPLVGSDDGSGWRPGQPVRRLGLFQVISASPWVLSVLDVRLMQTGGAPIEGVLELQDDQLPSLQQLTLDIAVLR